MRSEDTESQAVTVRAAVLGKAVRERRLQLGLSVNAAAARAGISRFTWAALEDGSRRTQEHNYSAIEQALGWAPGSFHSLLDGTGEPALADEESEEVWPQRRFMDLVVTRASKLSLDLEVLFADTGLNANLLGPRAAHYARPGLNSLRRLASRLGLPPVDLFLAAGWFRQEDLAGQDPQVADLPPDMAELIEVYRRPDLTEKDRKEILAAVRMAVRGTYLSVLRRQDAAQGAGRKPGKRAG